MARKSRVRSNVVSLERPASGGARVCEAALGRLVGTGSEGEPLVQISGDGELRAARSTVRLRPSDVGREVTLLVEVMSGGPAPVITGVVAPPREAGRALATGVDELRLDGERVVLSAEREITLRCGQALITLTRDGKVLVKGANLLQTSSGLNRIKGAAVQIN